MLNDFLKPTLGITVVCVLAGCASSSQYPITDSYGPEPKLPEPKTSLLPTVNIAPAEGWPNGAMPTPAEGLKVKAFAKGLEHPRWLYVLPNGDVLVAETDAPPKPKTAKVLKVKS